MTMRKIYTVAMLCLSVTMLLQVSACKKEDDKKLNKTNICMALKLIEAKDAIKEKK